MWRARSRESWALGVASISLGLSIVPPAHAGNEDEILVGGDAAMMGGAVVATVRDGGAVWYNPGGIASVERNQVDVTTSVYSLRLYSAPGFLRTAQGANARLSAVDFVAAPVQISYVRPLTSKISIGLGYFSPRATKLIVNQRLVDSSADTSTDWTVTGISTYSELGLGAALGWSPAAGLRVGAGGMVRWDGLVESLDVSGSGATAGATNQVLQVTDLHAQDLIGIEPIAGLQWEVSEQLTVGVNLRGPRLSVFNKGDETQRSAVVDARQEPVFVGAVTEKSAISRTAFSLVRWGRYYAGAAYRRGSWLVSADVDFQPPYRNAAYGVRRRFTWNARLGCERQLTKVVTLGLGLFTDRAADDSENGTLVTAGGNFYGGTAGLRVSNETLLAKTERVDSLVFSSVFSLRYAQASARSSALTIDPTRSAAEALQVGETPLSVHEIAFYLGSGILF